MRYKTVEGFKFLHVANAFLSQVLLNPTYLGKKIEWDAALDLLYPEIANAEQSCYLLYVNNEHNPIYAGQYTGLFKDRWGLKRNKYIWHGAHDSKIKALLKAKQKVSIWLSIDPYTELSDGRKVNINKAIEQIIILAKQPEWNTTGKKKPDSAAMPVSSICTLHKNNLPDVAKKLWARFEDKALEDYIQQLLDKNKKKWGELQESKITDLSRCRHFLNYVDSGMEPEQALIYVWKEFP